MANTDIRPANGLLGFPLSGGNRHFVLRYTLNLASNPLAQNEILYFADIPAGLEIKKIVPRVLTAEGAVATFDVGDYTNAAPPVAIDADGYVDGVDGNAVAWAPDEVTISGEGVASPAYGVNGKLYTAAAVLGLTTPTAAGMDAAVIQLDVEVVRHD